MKLVKLVLVGLIIICCGCRNFYDVSSKYDNKGKIKSQTAVIYESKFTKKSVNFITEVEAVRVTLTDPATGSMFPQVALGWFWTAFLEAPLHPGGRLFFFKESQSAFSSTITGKTILYIENNSSNVKNIKIDSKPIFYINIPLIKVGFGKNITTIDVQDKRD